MSHRESSAVGTARLLDRCRALPRDDRAWTEFVALCDARVFALARRTLLGLGHRSDVNAEAADLRMDMWVRLVRNDHERMRCFEGESESALFAYFRRTLRNLALDLIRDERVTRRPTEVKPRHDHLAALLAEFADDSPSPLDLAELSTLESRVRSTLQQEWQARARSERDVALCLMAWFQRLSAERLAEIESFGLSRGGIEKVVDRGLRVLRQRWGGDSRARKVVGK
jgi:RNA polymerase sigma factor (sigma-70 family)